MPTLDFKGKQFVYTHHLSVPFRTLDIDPAKSLSLDGAPSFDDNLIIHGDNLHALKALLPTYAGKVNCIYIDPPYNTGTEGWCYSDKVNSPLMREWLKKEANPVDKEDLERHDKWLCMMWPRLQLLRELLADDGVIFISIDDNEVHRLREACDEIFGEANFFSQFVWKSRVSEDTRAKTGISNDHEYILCYGKFEAVRLRGAEKDNEKFSNPDNDPRGPWRNADITGLATREQRPNLHYDLIDPETEINYGCPPKGWRYDPATMAKKIEERRILWPPEPTGRPRHKLFQEEMKSRFKNISSVLTMTSTSEGTREINNILGSGTFDFPKPSALLVELIRQACPEDGIVLDSFAGSGTTAHAVLTLNQEDDGSRRFILIEMEDYASTLTAERVRRVIEGYEFQGTQRNVLLEQKITYTRLKNAEKLLKEAEEIEAEAASRFDAIRKEVKDGIFVVTGEKQITECTEGLGGSFTFCTLGEEINVTSLLKGNDLPSYESLARYVFFTATGKTLGDLPKRRPDWLIGETDLYRVHLIYQPDREFLRGQEAALNAEMVDIITGGKGLKAPKKALVFASVKFMGQRELTERNIEFCQIPYAIHRILGD